MILAREVPAPVHQDAAFARMKAGKLKLKRRRGRVLARFPDLAAARRWLIEQTDAKRAGVYLQYRDGH